MLVDRYKYFDLMPCSNVELKLMGHPVSSIFCSTLGLFGCVCVHGRLPWLCSFSRDASNVISTPIQQIFCCIVDLILGRIGFQ